MSALQRGSDFGKQQAGLLLWQLLNVAATASTNPAVAAQCAASDSLVPGISWALHAQSSAAAGIVQALTYDGHRWVTQNSQTCLQGETQSRLFFCVPQQGEWECISRQYCMLYSSNGSGSVYQGHDMLWCRRITNSVTKGPDSDAMRLCIVAAEANVIPQLIMLMCRQGE